MEVASTNVRVEASNGVDSVYSFTSSYDLSSVYPITVTRTPPIFVASELDIDAGVLTITFSETIDAASIVPAKMHVRESGNYRGRHNPDCRRAWHRRRQHYDLVCPHSIAPRRSRGTGAPELTIEPGRCVTRLATS